MGRGFRPRAAHLVKNNLSNPPGAICWPTELIKYSKEREKKSSKGLRKHCLDLDQKINLIYK